MLLLEPVITDPYEYLFLGLIFYFLEYSQQVTTSAPQEPSMAPHDLHNSQTLFLCMVIGAALCPITLP